MTTTQAATAGLSFQRRAKIGILGGGQLGRMLAKPAHDFGLQTVVYCQHDQEPAAQIATQTIVGDWKDEAAIEQFATSGIRWVMGEWENVEPLVVEQVGQHVNVHSMAKVLRIGRSRRVEKSLAKQCGATTTRWAIFDKDRIGELIFRGDNFPHDVPIIVKTDNGGYDGKGQWSFDNTPVALKHEWHRESALKFIIEEKVAIDYECSILVERNVDGHINVSPAVRNRHTDVYGGGILEYSYWRPGAVSEQIEQAAQKCAVRIARFVDLVGVICVEFFVTKDGKLLFNELAPRVHNSFHGSIEAANFSQFHRHMAAVTGIRLPPMTFHSPWFMLNLIGDQILFADQLAASGWSVHDYGKTSSKIGRKMGHATRLGNQSEIDEMVATIQKGEPLIDLARSFT